MHLLAHGRSMAKQVGEDFGLLFSFDFGLVFSSLLSTDFLCLFDIFMVDWSHILLVDYRKYLPLGVYSLLRR